MPLDRSSCFSAPRAKPRVRVRARTQALANFSSSTRSTSMNRWMTSSAMSSGHSFSSSLSLSCLADLSLAVNWRSRIPRAFSRHWSSSSSSGSAAARSALLGRFAARFLSGLRFVAGVSRICCMEARRSSTVGGAVSCAVAGSGADSVPRCCTDGLLRARCGSAVAVPSRSSDSGFAQSGISSGSP